MFVDLFWITLDEFVKKFANNQEIYYLCRYQYSICMRVFSTYAYLPYIGDSICPAMICGADVIRVIFALVGEHIYNCNQVDVARRVGNVTKK